MSWIFACGLRFNRKSQPCIFFRWFVLHFRVKTYAKNSRLQDASLVSLFGKTIGFFYLARSTTDCKKSRRVFCIRFNWKTKRKPAEKNTGLWLSIKSETTCKNSAHLDEKKKNRPKFDIQWLCSKVFNYDAKGVRSGRKARMWIYTDLSAQIATVKIDVITRWVSFFFSSEMYIGLQPLGIAALGANIRTCVTNFVTLHTVTQTFILSRRHQNASL